MKKEIDGFTEFEIMNILEKDLCHSRDCLRSEKEYCDCGILKTAKSLVKWVNKNYERK